MTHSTDSGIFSTLATGGLTPFLNFIGAFHPATTHLPIGLLMAAGIIEAFNIVRHRGTAKPNQAAVVCLCLGAAGSILTAAVGWGLRTGKKDTDLIELHRWMGVGLVVFSIVAAVIAVAAIRRPKKPIIHTYQAGTFLSAALVGLVGMYGGEVSFGANHYEEAWQAMLAEYRDNNGTVAKKADPPKTSTAKTQALTSQRSTVLNATDSSSLEFTRDIHPIFEALCVKCHGPEKQKGDYRSDTKEHAYTVGETKEEKPIIPGDSSKSLLMKVLIGEGDYEDKKMPPKGKPQPTAEQIATIKKWIDQGAE